MSLTSLDNITLTLYDWRQCMFKILIAEDDNELRQLFSHVLIKTAIP